MVSKFDVSIYGFAELDTIWDSTQSLNDVGGNPVIAKADSYAGQHGRMTFSLRNSRIGFSAVSSLATSVERTAK